MTCLSKKIQFNCKRAKVEIYTLTSSNTADRDPKSWTLSASNDGKEWVELDKRSGETFTSRRYTRPFAIDASKQGKYQYYRLAITEASGTEPLRLAEVEFLALYTEAVKLDVSVSTPSIVETLAANLEIAVAGDNVDDLVLSAYLKVGDELLYKTAIVNGKGLMRIPAAPAKGQYSIVVDDANIAVDGQAIINVVELPENIWNPEAVNGPSHLSIVNRIIKVTFNSKIEASSKGLTAVLDTEDAIMRSVRIIDDNIIEIYVLEPDNLAKEYGATISGVKYPELFPSYSFTFTLKDIVYLLSPTE